MKPNQDIASLKTPMPASYPSPPRDEESAREPRQHAVSLLHPRPVGSSRGEGYGPVVRRNHARIILAFAVTAVLLAGCTVGPNYSRPTVATPLAWKETAATTNATVLPA